MSEPSKIVICECRNWCRSIPPKQYLGLRMNDAGGSVAITNHHENCPHYNDSLIDVWKMTVGGVSAYTDDQNDIGAWKQYEFEDETTITKEKMHREVLEHLAEFEGF